MAASRGFLSYVHADDDAEGGRIAMLARDVATQFEMLSGEPLDLFLDRDAIKWGDAWQDKVDSSLASVAFFIAVLTPRYFVSPECRRELQFFARKATRLGLKDLLLPLLYVDVPDLHDDSSSDDLLVLIRSFQWEDWQELRFADRSSEAYRRGVARLAAQLFEANRRVEKTDIAERALNVEHADDDSPGLLDSMASAEDTLPKLIATLEAIAGDIVLIGQLMHEATADIHAGDAHAKAFANRLRVARTLSRKLAEPAERIVAAANDYVSQLHEVDQGVRLLIEKAPAEIGEAPSGRDQVCTFFRAVRQMSQAAHSGLVSAQGMSDSIAPIEKMSRDLRPVVRRLRQGLTAMAEAREVTDEWVQLIEASGVDCIDEPAAGGP